MYLRVSREGKHLSAEDPRLFAIFEYRAAGCGGWKVLGIEQNLLDLRGMCVLNDPSRGLTFKCRRSHLVVDFRATGCGTKVVKIASD